MEQVLITNQFVMQLWEYVFVGIVKMDYDDENCSFSYREHEKGIVILLTLPKILLD